MRCKNIECKNETTGKRVYCSLTCRNVFVNKYLRNYEKYSNTCEQKKKEREVEYLKDPKRCKNCNEILEYDIKENEFCNRSCSGIFSNMNGTQSLESRLKRSESIKKHIKENGVYGALKHHYPSKKIRIKKVYPVKKCNNCGVDFYGKNKFFCADMCRKEYDRKNMTEYQKYKQDTKFKFSLNEYPDEFEFSLIEKYGWYSPSNKSDNLGGVSRDHMLSVSEGFELGIDPFLLAHPANCKLLIHTDNISKNKKSTITFDELLNKIKNFDEKYGK